MAFTMAELRHELHALGYGALPDDFIVSSLSQLQLEVPPQSRGNVEMMGERDGSVPSRRVRFAEKSSQQVHGPPVPGDREFATSKKRTVRKGGMDSVCFTPDFATELDEMKKMLRVMQGTKEEIFGSGSGASTARTTRKPVGLADEHELYVGNLLDRWRVVGRSIRRKRKDHLSVDVGGLAQSDSPPSSETTTQGKCEQTEHAAFGNSESNTGHRQKYEAFLHREIQPLSKPSTSGDLESPSGRCEPQAEGFAVVESNEGNRSAQDGFSSALSMGTAKEGIITNDSNEEVFHEGNTDKLKIEREGPVGVQGIDAGPVFTRQESSSAISPGVSYQQGGMLYPENFTTDTYQRSEPIMSEEIALPSREYADDNLLPSFQEAENNPFVPSPRSSSDQLTKDQMLDKLSSMSKDQFLAAFEKSLDDLYPKDIVDQETFEHVNQKISESISDAHVSGRQHIGQQPAESENPLDLGVPVVVRIPDRRGGGGGRQSPLNDRSNMSIAEDHGVTKTEIHSAKALQRSSSVILKRSRSSRLVSRRNEIVEEATNEHLLNSVKGGTQVDSHLLLENKTTPASSARKLKSERVLGHSKSVVLPRRRNEIVEEANGTHLPENMEGLSQVDSHVLVENTSTPPSSARKLKSDKFNRPPKSAEKCSSSPRLAFRHTRSGSASDLTDLDISSLGLSPIRVREQPASALNYPSTRERSCVANGLSEHRLGSHCSACSTVRISSENNLQSTTTGSRSPFDKSLSETGLSEHEASPQHKRSVRKETGTGTGSLSKQKVPSNKSASVTPSAPLFDPKKNDLNSNSKMLLKTRQLGSSMDFASDSLRLSERRSPSLRSSAESSRSSGQQRAPSVQSQASKSNSVSPYTKGSFVSRTATPSATPKDILSSQFGKTPSFTSYASQSSAATKDTLTPGGPRRGGKVDRVARFAEMQNLWKNDKFLKTSSKRKPQSFHRIFARLHLSHERCTAAYRERAIEDVSPASTEPPPFVAPTALHNSEGVCTL